MGSVGHAHVSGLLGQRGSQEQRVEPAKADKTMLQEEEAPAPPPREAS